MPFVLDASVVITWALRDESHPTADAAFERMQGDFAIVPTIWWYEVRNVLLVSERRNRIAAEDCDHFLLSLSKFYIEPRAVEGDERVVRLARTHRLSVYDAAYLALAIEQKMALATLDKGLQTAALAESVVLLA